MTTRSESSRDAKLTQWAHHLDACAGSSLHEGFATHKPFQNWRARAISPLAASPFDNIDDRFWACASGLRTGESRSQRDASLDELDLDAHGPLSPQASTKTIEVWTESELAALQALGWIAHIQERRELFRKALSTCRWHIEQTQPDNATNRPWGIHLFVVMSEFEGSDDARLYAETLLHNCIVTHAIPDALSADILRDAAEALRTIDWQRWL